MAKLQFDSTSIQYHETNAPERGSFMCFGAWFGFGKNLNIGNMELWSEMASGQDSAEGLKSGRSRYDRAQKQTLTTR
jgi:hypothetical protein